MIHEDSALHGMSVLIPRSKDQSEASGDLVRSLGGHPVIIPLISFRETTEAHSLKTHDFTQYQWIIFTSSVSVEVFFTYVSQKTNLPKLAVIGKKTAEKLSQYDLKADFIPTEFVAETFTLEFLAILGDEQNIFLPKGNLARDYIKQKLMEAKHRVTERIVYENFFPDESKQLLTGRLLNDGIDILLFTSPSTIDHFMEIVEGHDLKNQISKSIIGCIGPIAAKRAEFYGLKVHAVPTIYTFKHLIKEVVKVIS